MTELEKDLYDSSDDDEKYSQGCGHSILLFEAAEEIKRLRFALNGLLSAVENSKYAGNINTDQAKNALIEPDRL